MLHSSSLIRYFFFVFLLHNYFAAHSQLDRSMEKESFPRRIYSDATNIGKASIHVFKRPLSWEKKEWITFGAFVGTTVAVSFADESINDFFKRNQSNSLTPFADAGDFIGQPEHQGPFLAVLLGTGVLINNEWMRETGSMIASTMITSGFLTAFGKEAFGRARPSKGEGSTSFKPFAGKAYHSLPSAHTSLSISSSWILARQIKPLALKIPFYAVPVLVGWSRLYDNAHWMSDVVVSSALSIACAEAVIQYYTKVKKDDKQANLLFLPTGQGVSITYLF